MIIKVDGASKGNPGRAACAIVCYKNNQAVDRKGVYLGKQTNNYAEWQGLILALNYVIENKIRIIGDKKGDFEKRRLKEIALMTGSAVRETKEDEELVFRDLESIQKRLNVDSSKAKELLNKRNAINAKYDAEWTALKS